MGEEQQGFKGYDGRETTGGEETGGTAEYGSGIHRP